MELTSGTLLEGGKYRIISTLGQGGFGITYLAEQTMTERQVCIKEFFPNGYYTRNGDSNAVHISSPEFGDNMSRFKAKFIKEAKTIARLNHPNIVHIFDAFEENNTAYYVMEYIEGESLSSIVKRQGALVEAEAVRFIRQLADALRYIHEQSIMHLDVKPANIMVRQQDERGILIDFGLSKHYDSSGDATTTTPVGVSHGFAPIEQYRSGGVSGFSPETDIYSLGATLYYLVAGMVPPEAAEIADDGLPTLPSHLSSTLCNAIERSMVSQRRSRPHSVDEFLALLDGGDNSSVVEPIMSPVVELDNTLIINSVTSLQDKTIIRDEILSPPNNEIWYTSLDGEIVEPDESSVFGATIVSNTYVNGKGVIKFDRDVTKIGSDAFEGCRSLTSVDIPNSVTKIGLEAFRNCIGLKRVNIPNSVTGIGWGAFWGCSSLTSVNIPNGVTEIGKRAFADCSSLTSVNIPNSIKEIGFEAFRGCSSIKEFDSKYATLDGRCLIIDNKLIAFAPSGLTNYAIPNSVTEIGNYALAGCSSLISVNIPNGVTAIGRGAFSGCSSLKSVNIPNSVTEIGIGAFDDGCIVLKTH